MARRINSCCSTAAWIANKLIRLCIEPWQVAETFISSGTDPWRGNLRVAYTHDGHRHEVQVPVAVAPPTHARNLHVSADNPLAHAYPTRLPARHADRGQTTTVHSLRYPSVQDIAARLVLYDRTLHFGRVKLGTTATQSTTLANRSNAMLTWVLSACSQPTGNDRSAAKASRSGPFCFTRDTGTLAANTVIALHAECSPRALGQQTQSWDLRVYTCTASGTYNWACARRLFQTSPCDCDSLTSSQAIHSKFEND